MAWFKIFFEKIKKDPETIISSMVACVRRVRCSPPIFFLNAPQREMKQLVRTPHVPEVPESSSAAVRARVQRDRVDYLFFVLSILLHYCNPMYAVLFGSIYSLLFVY